MKLPAAIAAILGGAILLFAASGGLPDNSEPRDVLDAVHQHDRTGRVFILREIASKEWGSDQEIADFHNSAMDKLREEREKPYIDSLANHLMKKTVSEFADELEKSK